MGTHEQHEDRELLERVRASDREALGELFVRHQPTLFRQMLFQTGDAESAHDVVQETFLKVWEHRSVLRPNLSFTAYLLRIGRNIVRDNARYRKVRERLEGKVSPPALSEEDNPEEAAALSMLQEKLVRALYEGLPERCRTVFILSRFEGKSNSEIAGMLGISVKTVENQVNKALRALRRRLSGDYPRSKQQ